MKRNLILMAALLLTSTLLTSCFKDRPDTSKEGLYVGIIGFNKELNTKTLKILNNNTKDEMKSFIDNLTMENGTILYHAVNTALDRIEAVNPPADLINVSIITFTDGMDQGSYEWNNNYNSGQEYLTAINNRIRNLSIGDNGVAIDAYAIGVKGSDVVDETSFRQNLAKLSSDANNNVYLMDSMNQMGAIFDSIAQQLYEQRSFWDVTLKVSAPELGTRIRFTFDNVTSADDSQTYIEGIYTNENNMSVFKNVTYYGLQDCGSVIYPATDPDRLKVFTFHNLLEPDDTPVQCTYAKLWYYANSTWYPNSEFTPSSNTVVEEDYRSAMIMLVLDCSSSLGNDFQTVKSTVRQFIETLNGSTHQEN